MNTLTTFREDYTRCGRFLRQRHHCHQAYADDPESRAPVSRKRLGQEVTPSLLRLQGDFEVVLITGPDVDVLTMSSVARGVHFQAVSTHQ